METHAIAAQTDPTGEAARKPERVGIVLVHGIGEQRRFEHLESHARDLIDAMLAREERTGRKTSVSVELIEAEGAPYKAEQASWSSAGPTLHAVVREDTGDVLKEVHLCFHEVWYADIAEAYSFSKQVRFWAWGLAMWAIPTKLGSTNKYYNRNLREPDLHPGAVAARSDAGDHARPGVERSVVDWLSARTQLYLVACLSLLATFSITPIVMILNRLNFGTFDFIRVFVNYISVVKLYNQKTRSGGAPLDALGIPPRYFMRQRMIRTVFDVASAKYDRWYILAHSLGSVVAFNALMEPSRVIPNYLDSRRWQKLKTDWPDVLYTADADISRQDRTPRRPAWIDPFAAVRRRKLFENFKGLLTYGSPLDKFATLWPARVPLNKDEAVFRDDVEWINVYDVTDPVGGHLDFFDPAAPAPGCLKPRNLCYKASWVILFSHINYLRIHPRRKHDLADLAVEWLVSGTRFPQPPSGSPAWPETAPAATADRSAFALLQWAIVAGVLFGLGWVVLVYFLPYLLPSWLAFLQPDKRDAALFLLIATFATPVLFGIGRRLLFSPDEDSVEFRGETGDQAREPAGTAGAKTAALTDAVSSTPANPESGPTR